MKKKKILYFLEATGIIIVIILYIIYRNLFGNSILTDKNKQVVCIPTGSSYEQVLDTLYSKLNITNQKAFTWLAARKHYPALIKPGRYVIDRGLSYNGLINLLRSGKQTPVRITFNNVR